MMQLCSIVARTASGTDSADSCVPVTSAEKNGKCCLGQTKAWMKNCPVLPVPAFCCPENLTLDASSSSTVNASPVMHKNANHPTRNSIIMLTRLLCEALLMSLLSFLLVPVVCSMLLRLEDAGQSCRLLEWHLHLIHPIHPKNMSK